MAAEVTFTPDADDYVAASRFHFRRQIRSARFWLRMLVVAVVTALGVAAIFGVIEGDLWVGVAVGLGGMAGGAAALAACLGVNWLLMPRRARRLIAQDRSFHQSTRVAWDADGIAWESASGSFRAGWSDHHRVAGDEAVTLFYANDQLFRLLPARALDATGRADLRATLEVARPPD